MDQPNSRSTSVSIPRPGSPRIAPFEGDLGATAAAALASTRSMGSAQPFNIFTTLAHHPRALKHTVALGGGFLFAANIPDRLREIVILRVARNTSCAYERAQHVPIGERCGLSRAEIDALAEPGDQPSGADWTPIEHATVTMVDELCQDDCVSDATWQALAAEFDDRSLVELLLVTGYYRMLAGFLNSAGVQVDPGL